MRSIRERLEDILDFCELIEAHLPSDRKSYDDDVVLKYFFMKQVEIVGEAVYKIDKDFKRGHPDVPWRKIERIRHFLVHDYFDVDWNVLWDVIHIHIQPLRLQVKELLRGLDD